MSFPLFGWLDSYSFIFPSSRCMTTMTWGRSSWTRPLYCPLRNSWKTSLKNSSLMWYISFLFSASWLQLELRIIRTFRTSKKSLLYCFIIFSYFIIIFNFRNLTSNSLFFPPGPWNRSFGHQFLAGLLNVCPLRPLQWNHWGPAVWHAAWDGCLQWTHTFQTLPGGAAKELKAKE